MKKKLLIILFALVLLLDFAALDDITTGNEPSFTLEYSILIASIPILVFITYQLLHKKSKKTIQNQTFNSRFDI
ncbi:hypothetical protein C4577_07780 [Candidatus Parcubacteria bacterium]|nr:MAG: hypothetical protein C4577_07780 [Candidatus Parcubacteria bacterium]